MVAPLDFHDERDAVLQALGLCASCVHSVYVGPVIAGPGGARSRAIQCSRHPRPSAAYYCPRPSRCDDHCESDT